MTDQNTIENEPPGGTGAADGSVRSDAELMVWRWKDRNPDFEDYVRDGEMSLEDLCALAIITWCGYNGIPIPNRD